MTSWESLGRFLELRTGIPPHCLGWYMGRYMQAKEGICRLLGDRVCIDVPVDVEFVKEAWDAPAASSFVESQVKALKQRLMNCLGREIALAHPTALAALAHEVGTEPVWPAFSLMVDEVATSVLRSVPDGISPCTAARDLLSSSGVVYDPRLSEVVPFIPGLGIGPENVSTKVWVPVPGWAVREILSTLALIYQAMDFAGVHVVISVDPFDIATCSDITTGWTTCQRLGGAYGQAPYSYLVDGCTFVAYAYREGDIDVVTGRPRKLWRQVIYADVDLNGLILGHHYPFFSPLYDRVVKHTLGPLLARCHGDLCQWQEIPPEMCSLPDFGDLSDPDNCRNSRSFLFVDPPAGAVGIPPGLQLKAYPGVGVLRCMHCGAELVPGSDDSGMPAPYCPHCLHEHAARCVICHVPLYRFRQVVHWDAAGDLCPDCAEQFDEESASFYVLQREAGVI